MADSVYDANSMSLFITIYIVTVLCCFVSLTMLLQHYIMYYFFPKQFLKSCDLFDYNPDSNWVSLRVPGQKLEQEPASGPDKTSSQSSISNMEIKSEDSIKSGPVLSNRKR